MQIALPFTEALALAATAGPLPPMVRLGGLLPRRGVERGVHHGG